MTPSKPPAPDAAVRPEFVVPEGSVTLALEAARVISAELSVADSRPERSVLQHELAEIDERLRGDELSAARGYLAAFNSRPGFRPPLDALIRLYTRRKSVNNLIKLYDALVKAAPSPRDLAEALTLRGELLDDRLMVERGARQAYEQAVSSDPENRLAWLDLHREALRAGDRELLIRVLTQLAALTQDPARRSHILLELSREHLAHENPSAAADCLREACALPLGRWRAFAELERFAETHDRPADLVFALEGRAELAEGLCAPNGSDGGADDLAIARIQDTALAVEESAGLWTRAARARLSRLDDLEGARRAMDQGLALAPEDSKYRYFAMILADQSGDIDRASEHAAWLLARDFGDPYLRASLHFRVAETQCLKGETTKASESLRAALGANPESAAARAALLEQLLATGDGAMVLHELDRLAESAPEDATRAGLLRAAGFYALALCKDSEGAMQRFRMACDSDPGDLLSRRALVNLLGRTSLGGSVDHARARARALDELLGLVRDADEREALLLERFSVARFELRDPRAAAQTAEKLVEATGESLWSLEAAARMWSAAGEMHHAARWAEALGERRDLPGGADEATAWRCLAARWQWAAGDSLRAREIAVLEHPRLPRDLYLSTLAQGLCLEAKDPAMAYDITLRHAEALGDPSEGTRWLLLSSLRFEHESAPEFSRRALEAAVARSPGDSAVRAAVLAATRWRGDSALRAVVAEAGLAADEVGPEELALGVELALVRAFVEHDLPKAITALEMVMARDRGESAAVALFHAIARGASDGPDAEATVDALKGVLSTIASSDPLRGGIELEVARALGASQSTREQAVAARELVDEDQPELAAPRLLALLDAVQRDGRQDVPAALGRVAALAEGETADALRSAAVISLSALGRTAEARSLADAHPKLAASWVVGAEHPAGIDRALEYSKRLGALSELSLGAHSPADARAAASWASVGGLDDEAFSRAEALISRDPGDLVALDVKRVSGRRIKQWRAVVDACGALGKRVTSAPRASVYWEEAGVVAAEELGLPKEAEVYLRASLAAAPGRDIAYRKLREILDVRKDTSGLEALVTARVASVGDPAVLTELCWEQSRLRRAMGQRERALESAQRVVELAPGHVAARALIAEVHAACGRLAETAEALALMAGCSETPAAQRKAARLGAMDLYELRLGKPQEALGQMDALWAEGSADDPLIERAVLLSERSGRFHDAARFAERAADRARAGVARAAALLRVAKLYRDRLGEPRRARDFALRAHTELPADLEALRVLQGVSDPEQRRQQGKRTADALREIARTGEITAALALGVSEAARSAGDGALERAASRMARVLGSEVSGPAPVFGEPSGATLRDPAVVLRYRHPADTGRALAVLEAVMPELGELLGLSTDRLKVGRGERIKGAHPLRAALAPYMALVGRSDFELYVGGPEGSGVSVIPGDPMAVVFGRAVALPWSAELRFELVRRLLLASRSLAPLAVVSSDAAAAHALAALVYAELSITGGTERLGNILKPVARALSRRVRRGLSESGKALAAAPDAWSELALAARGATATARRGALAVSGATRAAFADLSRYEGLTGQSLEVLLDGSASARELALFALSDAIAQVGRECGVDRGSGEG